jgi:hypothetical protein
MVLWVLIVLSNSTLLCFNQGCSLAYKQAISGPNSDGSKMRELKLLSSKLPTPSEFSQLTESDTVSEGTIASVDRTYAATVEYEKVKQFYASELPKQGWQFVRERNLTSWGQDYGERELRFRNGEYEIVITYAGKRESGWQYTVYISWRYSKNANP